MKDRVANVRTPHGAAALPEEASDLPEVGINQDNLDQLFGDPP